MKHEFIHMSFRIPKVLSNLMEEHLNHVGYSSKSEFIRSAIRQKIQRDTPKLYEYTVWVDAAKAQKRRI